MERNKILIGTLIIICSPGFGQVTIKKPADSPANVKSKYSPVNKEAISELRRTQSYDFSSIRLCLDEYRSVNIPPRSDVPVVVPPPRILPDGRIEEMGRLQQELTGVTKEMWSPGEVITVGFYKDETTTFVLNKVTQYAREWEKYANIKFSFIENVGAAQIKVGFKKGTSWSWVGREVMGNTFGNRTMNFGWFADDTAEEEFSSTTIHEFGHALGFIHEHQSPTSGIQWDKEKVYAFLGGPPNNWDRGTIDRNVFDRYSASSTNFSAYDPLSIMHYAFPAELTINNVGTPMNTYFSSTDIQFTKQVYPFQPEPATATGTLRTGDDCDEIDFLVEYNAVSKGVIEFILEPGIDKGGNRVSWWKQIGIPLKGGGQANLELAPDGHTDVRTIQLLVIDNTRAISFAKAKFAGVHTGLGYTWNVLPAIIGGCRVKLTWRNDHCY